MEKVAEGTQEALVRNAQEVAKKIASQAASNDANGSSFLQRPSGGFKRPFGC